MYPDKYGRMNQKSVPMNDVFLLMMILIDISTNVDSHFTTHLLHDAYRSIHRVMKWR